MDAHRAEYYSDTLGNADLISFPKDMDLVKLDHSLFYESILL